MTVCDALKRLEAVGGETSRVTEKLITAAELIADRMAWDIAGICNLRELPRGYRYVVLDMNAPLGVRSKAFIVKDGFILNHNSARSCSCYTIAERANSLGDLGIHYYQGDYGNVFLDSTPFYIYRQFARDIATGLFDEIAKEFEKERDGIERELEACSSALN